jgi:succinyl-diaminopimelate desuccinylase
MVIACLRLAELSKGKAGLTLIITASEEDGCRGAHYLAQHGTILGTAGALIVGEPTSNYPLVGHKGAIFLEAQTYGTAAHGSMPEQGINAIYKAARAVRKLEMYDFDFPAHPLFGSPTLNVGTIAGGGTINVVPDQASIGIDIRTVPGQSNGEVMADIESCLGTDVELTCLTDAGAVFTDPEHEWVQHVYDIMKSFLSERPVPRGASYFTDASALTPVMGNPPTIILGPGEPEMAHKTDEFCYISKIEEAAEAYIEIGRTWSGL